MLRAGTQCQSVRLTRTVLLSKGASLLYIPGTSGSFYGLAGQEQSSRFLQEEPSSRKRSRRWQRWCGALLSVRGTTEHGSSSSTCRLPRFAVFRRLRHAARFLNNNAPRLAGTSSRYFGLSTLFLFPLPCASCQRRRARFSVLPVYPLLPTPSLPQASSPPYLEHGGLRHILS